MAHRSRVGIVLIDLPEHDYQAGLDFWSAATGNAVSPHPEAPYAGVGTLAGIKFEMQRTGAGTPARLHLDIETDDIEAEVSRLEALGAARVEDRGRFWTMLDPAGLVFCVVGIQTGDFEQYAVSWP